MPLVSDFYNYATPLHLTTGVVQENFDVVDRKYFGLFDNRLDGSYYPLSGNSAFWYKYQSDEYGDFMTPVLVRVNEHMFINAIRVVGSTYNYPTYFRIIVYTADGEELTTNVSKNTEPVYVHYFDRTIEATGYELHIYSISQPRAPAMLYNLYNPGYVKRSDSLAVSYTYTSAKPEASTISTRDTLSIAAVNQTGYIVNTINRTNDKLPVVLGDKGKLINIHSVMKDISRRVYAKVLITYTDPMLAGETEVIASDEAYNSNIAQVLDGVNASDGRFFTLYDNNLSGKFYASDEVSQVGWVSAKISDAQGSFGDDEPYIRVNFASRPIINLPIHFDDSHGSVASDFTVEFTQESGNVITVDVHDNTLADVIIDSNVADAVSVVVTVHKVTKPGYPVAILDIPVVSEILYVGYHDKSNIMSIDFLEELTYEDDVEALGGISANEVTVVLDNSKREFFFNNKNSIVSSQLRRNRKIVPWLGAELAPGIIEWYKLGVFWSYNWNVPAESLTATVVGFDTIGLLDTTTFINHAVCVDASIADLVRYVLDDAKTTLDFIEYDIDPELEDIRIPYAWFEKGSHTAALRRISNCYPVHIYCDREGRICARLQKLRMDYYYDTWADNTNVVSKTYSSMHTTLPNIISVTIKTPNIVPESQLVEDKLVFNIASISTRTLIFDKPFVDNLAITIDCDSTVKYSYIAYSWGIVINFTGSGAVRSILCKGDALEFVESTLIERNEDSIRLNGAITRDINAEFIQTSEHAASLINRLLSLSEYDKYDAQVSYRGDISLSINDPILLLDGIAPDNRYNIKRHELSWNGSLTGSADLNT